MLWYAVRVQGTLPNPKRGAVGVGLVGTLFQVTIRLGTYTRVIAIHICKYYNKTLIFLK